MRALRGIGNWRVGVDSAGLGGRDVSVGWAFLPVEILQSAVNSKSDRNVQRSLIKVHVDLARGTSKARSPTLQRGVFGRQTKAAVERRKGALEFGRGKSAAAVFTAVVTGMLI